MPTVEKHDLREEIRVPDLPEPISHYTDAVRFGDLLFISGCAPLDREGRLVGGDDVVAQTRQIFSNMAMILARGPSTFADILKVTVFLKDIADRKSVDVVRREVFGASRPASTLIGVAALAIPGMKVEIEAVAAIRRTGV
jgi:reactive intermediate/imine deaminase